MGVQKVGMSVNPDGSFRSWVLWQGGREVARTPSWEALMAASRLFRLR